MNNIDTGKLYGNNDMVKVGCHDCKGCSSCCQDMGQSIWLDPCDVCHMTAGLGKSFEELLAKEIELHVEDGLIMPNIRMVAKMQGTAASTDAVEEPRCSFLNEEERCSIHIYRPGFCRLFPLGRNYDGDKLTYFLLEDACPAQNKTKMKINKWLNVPRIKDYEKFLVEWHTLTKGLRCFYEDNSDNEAIIKALNLQFLQIFYLAHYGEGDFYPQFEERMEKMNSIFEQLQIVLPTE